MKKKVPNIQYTVKHGLCCGCGICEGVCPQSAISIEVKKGNFRPIVNIEKCINSKGCHKCYDVCPGLGCQIKKEADELFKEDVKEDRYAGKYHKAYVGYSNDEDLRYHAASGGMTTQFLIWLIENKEIDGAVVTRFDKASKLKVNTFIATTHDELLTAKSSKYAPVSMAGIIRAIKSAKGKRYVVVGLPCHIQGFRKAEKYDTVLRNKIVGHFAIYCSAGRSFYFTEYLMKERNINLNKVDYIAYRDRGNQGGLVVQGKGIDYYQDYRKYSHPLRSIFVPRRCLFCIDHYGELADISFGDINIPPFNEDKIGINSIIVRNPLWNEKLLCASTSCSVSLNEVNIVIINKSQPSAKMKKNRNLDFVNIFKRLGKIVPVYDNVQNHNHIMINITKYIANRLQQFVGRNKMMWPLIKVIKK